ncbi:hypothetical protein NKG05_22355 [Oerskovia sp. M15]
MTLQYETDGGALGSAVISQVSAGRKNRLFLEISGSESTLTFDQEAPRASGKAAATRAACSSATPRRSRPRPPATRGSPRDTPGIPGLLQRPRRRHRGSDQRADARRAAHVRRRAPGSALAEAVARSARTGTWVEVGA